jgi:hypothetical protein
MAAALVVALASATASTPAFAQTSEDSVIKAARARFDEGVAFYDKGQYENARVAFLQAYALRKHPAVLVNLAQCDLRSGRAVEAAKYFQQYLVESTWLSTTQRSDAEKGLAEARNRIGRLEVSAPEGTEIEVDGDRVGTAPLPEAVNVEPGSHTVKSSSDSRTVTVGAGQVEPVRLSAPTPAVVAPSPPAEEPTPVRAPSSPSTETKPAAVASEAETNAPGLFSPPRSTAPVWIGVGIGIAGGATAILFAVFRSQAILNAGSVSNQITNAATAAGATMTRGLCLNPPSQNFQQACQTLQNDNNVVNTDTHDANAGLVVGITGVAFGLGWYLFAPRRNVPRVTDGASGAFVPIVGPHWNGLGYASSF